MIHLGCPILARRIPELIYLKSHSLDICTRVEGLIGSQCDSGCQFVNASMVNGDYKVYQTDPFVVDTEIL